MNQVITREFVQHFKKYKRPLEPIFVKDRNEVVGVYVSIKEWEQKTTTKKPKRLTREDLKKYQFSTGETDLSQCIDQIYGL